MGNDLRSFAFASESKKDNELFVKSCFEMFQSGFIYRYTSMRVKNLKSIALEALSASFDIYPDIPRGLREDPDVIQLWARLKESIDPESIVKIEAQAAEVKIEAQAAENL